MESKRTIKSKEEQSAVNALKEMKGVRGDLERTFQIECRC